MAKYRVKAYFMHEHEQEAATKAAEANIIEGAEWTPGYVLGVVDEYAEATNRPYGLYPFTNPEWSFQDNRRLALDLGLRFHHDPPQPDVRGQTSSFLADVYDPAPGPPFSDIR